MTGMPNLLLELPSCMSLTLCTQVSSPEAPFVSARPPSASIAGQLWLNERESNSLQTATGRNYRNYIVLTRRHYVFNLHAI